MLRKVFLVILLVFAGPAFAQTSSKPKLSLPTYEQVQNIVLQVRDVCRYAPQARSILTLFRYDLVTYVDAAERICQAVFKANKVRGPGGKLATPRIGPVKIQGKRLPLVL